jgi:hypothetical protein
MRILLMFYMFVCLVGCNRCHFDNGKIKLSPTPIEGKLHKVNFYAPTPVEPEGKLYAPTPPDCSPCKIYEEQELKKQNS